MVEGKGGIPIRGKGKEVIEREGKGVTVDGRGKKSSTGKRRDLSTGEGKGVIIE